MNDFIQVLLEALEVLFLGFSCELQTLQLVVQHFFFLANYLFFSYFDGLHINLVHIFNHQLYFQVVDDLPNFFWVSIPNGYYEQVFYAR